MNDGFSFAKEIQFLQFYKLARMIAPVSLISILSGIMYLLTSGLKAGLIQLKQICLTRPTFKSQLLVSVIDRDYGMHFHQSKHTKIPNLNRGMSNIFSFKSWKESKNPMTRWVPVEELQKFFFFWVLGGGGGWKGDVENGFND